MSQKRGAERLRSPRQLGVVSVTQHCFRSVRDVATQLRVGEQTAVADNAFSYDEQWEYGGFHKLRVLMEMLHKGRHHSAYLYSPYLVYGYVLQLAEQYGVAVLSPCHLVIHQQVQQTKIEKQIFQTSYKVENF